MADVIDVVAALLNRKQAMNAKPLIQPIPEKYTYGKHPAIFNYTAEGARTIGLYGKWVLICLNYESEQNQSGILIKDQTRDIFLLHYKDKKPKRIKIATAPESEPLWNNSENMFERLFVLTEEEGAPGKFRAHLKYDCGFAAGLEKACIEYCKYYCNELSKPPKRTDSIYDHVYCTDDDGEPRPARWRESIKIHAVYLTDEGNEVNCHSPAERVIEKAVFIAQSPKRSEAPTPTPQPAPPADLLSCLDVQCLQKVLKKCGLATRGKKAALQARLREFFAPSPPNEPATPPRPGTAAATPDVATPSTPFTTSVPLPSFTPTKFWTFSEWWQRQFKDPAQFDSIDAAKAKLGQLFLNNPNTTPSGRVLMKTRVPRGVLSVESFEGFYGAFKLKSELDQTQQLIIPVFHRELTNNNGHVLLAYYDPTGKPTVEIFDPNGPYEKHLKNIERMVARVLKTAPISDSDKQRRFKAMPQRVLSEDFDIGIDGGMCQFCVAMKLWSMCKDNDRMESIHDTIELDDYFYNTFRKDEEILARVFKADDKSQVINTTDAISRWLPELLDIVDQRILEFDTSEYETGWLDQYKLDSAIKEHTTFYIRSKHPDDKWTVGDSITLSEHEEFDIDDGEKVISFWYKLCNYKYAYRSDLLSREQVERLFDFQTGENAVIPELGLKDVHSLIQYGATQLSELNLYKNWYNPGGDQEEERQRFITETLEASWLFTKIKDGHYAMVFPVKGNDVGKPVEDWQNENYELDGNPFTWDKNTRGIFLAALLHEKHKPESPSAAMADFIDSAM
ncbi:MAG: hypothetical protein CL678_07550 [Bdellovibrionaceae bacterium]|nr:hypothetical protein [Pseudobdellovibrionaceae bacterium]